MPRKSRAPTSTAMLFALAPLLALVACDGNPTAEPAVPAAAPQMAKTPSTMPVTVTVTDMNGDPVSSATVGIVGASGPVEQKPTDPDGKAEFTLQYGKQGGQYATYCAWASGIDVSSLNKNGAYPYIVPPDASGGGIGGLTDKGPVVTTLDEQEVVTQTELTQQTYVDNCVQSRPIELKTSSSQADFTLALTDRSQETLTVRNFDGGAVNGLLYVLLPFDWGWEPLPTGIQDVFYGFLAGAVEGGSNDQFEFGKPPGQYKAELLASTSNGVPGSLSLTSNESGELSGDSFILQPHTCNITTVADASGDGYPDIGDVSFGFGADEITNNPDNSHFSAWFPLTQLPNSTVSLKYNSRTDVADTRLQLYVNFDVTQSGTDAAPSCSIGNLSVSGSAYNAGIDAAVSCAAVSATVAQITITESGLPDDETHTIAITTPGNPGSADFWPDAAKADDTSSQTGTTQCESIRSRGSVNF